MEISKDTIEQARNDGSDVDEFKVRAGRLVKALQDVDGSFPQGPQPELVEECATVLASIALSFRP
jgi:hypothetical protein